MQAENVLLWLEDVKQDQSDNITVPGKPKTEETVKPLRQALKNDVRRYLAHRPCLPSKDSGFYSLSGTTIVPEQVPDRFREEFKRSLSPPRMHSAPTAMFSETRNNHQYHDGSHTLYGLGSCQGADMPGEEASSINKLEMGKTARKQNGGRFAKPRALNRRPWRHNVYSTVDR